MVRKRFRSLTNEVAVGLSAGCAEKALSSGLVGLLRVAIVEGVWRVCQNISFELKITKRCLLTGRLVLVNEVLCRTISVVVVNWTDGSVDGNLFKVGTAMSIYLRIEVREDATLK